MNDWDIELPLVVYIREGTQPVATRTLRIGERGISFVLPATVDLNVGEQLIVRIPVPHTSWLGPVFRYMPSVGRVTRTEFIDDHGVRRLRVRLAFARFFIGPWSRPIEMPALRAAV